MLLKHKKRFFLLWLVSVLSYYTLNSCAFANVDIVQQNPGPNASSRATFPLIFKDGKWIIENYGVLGYLRKM